MGRAQYLQALAARVTPQVRMNPILLKPSAETFSQVIVNGKVDNEIGALPWMERKDRLWPIVKKSLHNLIEEFDQVVIEGAGSPAETNLRASDIVNMSVALECKADVYLVADIDRGGAFAHLLGTWMLLEPEERALIKGFILNKFRGDVTLLRDAPATLQKHTRIPVVAVIPKIHHTLPEEDALHHRASFVKGQINIALILYPYASNLDEFDPLIHEAGVNVVPVKSAQDLISINECRAILLPGSKNIGESLHRLHESGLADAILAAAEKDVPIFGVCGGMQLLGKHILDPHRLEGGDSMGLGLLDLTTTLASEKITRQREAKWIEGDIARIVKGYEIHHGMSVPIYEPINESGPLACVHIEEGLGWRQGTVTGVYLHGLFENTEYRQHFLEDIGWGGVADDWNARLDSEIDRVGATDRILVVAFVWAAPPNPHWGHGGRPYED